MEPLSREFYERETLKVAQELLGKYLVHQSPQGRTVVKIVETEAYVGITDAACHAYQGKYTLRTQVMYGAGGHAYVYLIYGVYYCLNVVTGPREQPEAVLIRAAEPLEGAALMMQRRNTDKLLNLCSGPGKLCQALGIGATHNGLDLCQDILYVTAGEEVRDEEILATPRLNIDYAGEARDYPWRFILQDSPFISGTRRQNSPAAAGGSC